MSFQWFHLLFQFLRCGDDGVVLRHFRGDDVGGDCHYHHHHHHPVLGGVSGGVHVLGLLRDRSPVYGGVRVLVFLRDASLPGGGVADSFVRRLVQQLVRQLVHPRFLVIRASELENFYRAPSFFFFQNVAHQNYIVGDKFFNTKSGNFAIIFCRSALTIEVTSISFSDSARA